MVLGLGCALSTRADIGDSVYDSRLWADSVEKLLAASANFQEVGVSSREREIRPDI